MELILLFFLLIILFYFIKKKNLESFHNYNLIDQKADYLINKLIVLKSNKYYRIGDIYYNISPRHYENIDKQNVLQDKQFKDSILQNYLLKNKNNQENLDLLKQVINDLINKKNFNLPKNNELVIHLRAGDVVVRKNFLNKDYIKLIKHIIWQHPNINKITFVCCLQYGNYEEKNRWQYSEEKNNLNKVKIKDLLKKIIYHFPEVQIDVLSNYDIDKDIIYMVKSTHFIEGEGRVSKLINELRNNN